MNLAREFNKKFSTTFIVVLTLLSLFVIFYTVKVKDYFISHYRAKIAKNFDDLQGEQKKMAQETLTRLEKGQLIPEEEHDTSDYMHEAYFGEPWRKWESTPIVWMKARSYLFVYLLLVLFFIPGGKLLDWLSLTIARKKLINAQKKAKLKPAAPKKSPPDSKPLPAAKPYNQIGLSFPMDSRVVVIVIIILFGILISLARGLTRDRLEYFPTSLDRPIGVQLFSELIGESRTILAAYIYIRADMYHHERETKLAWNKDPATLPLYRIITALDPKYVNAYDFGGWHLAKNFKKYNEGIGFLMEGLRYNPDSFQLYFTIGDVYYFKGDYRAAIKYYMKALVLAQHQVDIKNTLRRLYWSNRRIKHYKLAGQYLQMMYNLDPGEPAMKNMAKELKQLISGEKTEEQFEKIKKKMRLEYQKQHKGHKHDDHSHHGHSHKGHNHGHSHGGHKH